MVDQFNLKPQWYSLLKAKLARYRAQLLEPTTKSGPVGQGFDVQKSGGMTHLRDIPTSHLTVGSVARVALIGSFGTRIVLPGREFHHRIKVSPASENPLFYQKRHIQVETNLVSIYCSQRSLRICFGRL